MLAIEVVLGGTDPVPTFVFDEVDAGVGGKAAVEVGRRLAQLARSAQVVVVTHLPQVAAFADRHVVVTKSAEGSQDHVEVGTPMTYPDSPPAFGQHWNMWDSMERKLYTTSDRPELGELVHNLEHGFTILWYDETIAEDSDQMDVLRGIASKLQGTENLRDKFKAVPWTSEDGKDFPEGQHIAMSVTKSFTCFCEMRTDSTSSAARLTPIHAPRPGARALAASPHTLSFTQYVERSACMPLEGRGMEPEELERIVGEDVGCRRGHHWPAPPERVGRGDPLHRAPRLPQPVRRRLQDHQPQ